ncbi:MAG: ankyrin repeat domain-containing protein [Maribacter sp.]|nr:ankyrin repeat domain-containing protein [Maribacter sp.]
MDYLKKISVAFELHSVEDIKACFENGVDPNAMLDGRPLIHTLINMYTRGPGFKRCIQVFVDYGVVFDDPFLLAVLLDNDTLLDKLVSQDVTALNKKYTFQCTFTPLYEVSLLHICAEYNHLSCAKILIKHGANSNLKAGFDEYGFGGHTPIFHTVNQDANKSIDMLKYLVSLEVDLTVTVAGLIWGKGYDWETFIPSVNPISYAMMGLLRQFQRTEAQIYEVVKLLMKARYGINYVPKNIPNRYLNS